MLYEIIDYELSMQYDIVKQCNIIECYEFVMKYKSQIHSTIRNPYEPVIDYEISTKYRLGVPRDLHCYFIEELNEVI